MSKVVLAPKPNFELPVQVPQLGGAKVEITVTYKYRKLQEYAEFMAKAGRGEFVGRSDAEMVLDVAEAWNVDAPFTTEGIGKACDDTPGMGAAIVNTYLAEYARVRAGN